MELTVLIPCLNEEKTLAICISKAKQFFEKYSCEAEVLVVDNGSTDNSMSIAESSGARVVVCKKKGYGAALIAGINASNGKYIIMGDADDSYDFSKLELYLKNLRKGVDLVIGNRFSGGIEKGAMPFLHRYIGNPTLSFIGRIFFKAEVFDFHCGLRGVNKDKITKLKLNSNGMEFASEMVVKATLAHYKIVEVPTTLSKDGRDRKPHLNTWRDGWRHLVLLFGYAPNWSLLYPSILLLFIGFVGLLSIYIEPISIGNITFSSNTMLFSSCMVLIGLTIHNFYIVVTLLAWRMGFLYKNSYVSLITDFFSLGKSVVISLLIFLLGLYLGGKAIFEWAEYSFGVVQNESITKISILSCFLMVVGIQTLGFSLTLNSLKSFSSGIRNE